MEKVGTLPPQRATGVDAGRFVMALLVIVLHAFPVSLPGRDIASMPAWPIPFIAVARMAVPYFFVASGYFLRTPPSLRAAIVAPLTRIMPIYAITLAGYAVLLWLDPLRHVNWTILGIIRGDVIAPLWFLQALIAAQMLVGVGLFLGRPRTACVVTLVLALCGPVLADYIPLITHHAYPWRLVPILRHLEAPVLVWVGTQIHRMRVMPVWFCFCGILMSLGCLLGEQSLITAIWHSPGLIEPDVVCATFPLGIFAFCLARSLNAPAWFARLGALSLNVYLIHFGFIMAFRTIWPLPDPHDSILVAVLAMVCATLGALGLRMVSVYWQTIRTPALQLPRGNKDENAATIKSTEELSRADNQTND